LQVAAVDRVMGQLLADVPIQVSEVGSADAAWPIHVLALQPYFQVNVIGPMAAGSQVRKRRRTLHGTGGAERLQRFHGYDARRDGSGKILSQERSKGHIFPCLDVSRDP